MSTYRNRRLYMLAILASTSLLQISNAHAQEAAPNETSDIIVTAQKREQSIQDVGVAVTALSPAALNSIDVNDPTQLVQIVPSLQVQQYSSATTVYNIRGVSQNDFSDFQEGPNAFYVDEVYIGALGALANQTFDVERVEVLRGPQGTLFGRNATGGLVQVIAAKPSTTWKGFGTLTLGSYNQVSTELGIGGPISDHIRFRISGATNYNEGYYNNLNPAGKDGGSSRNYAGRAQLEFDVGERGTLRLSGTYIKNDDETIGVNGWAAGFDEDGLGFRLSPDSNFYANLAAFAANKSAADYFANFPGGSFCTGCTVFGYQFSDDPYEMNTNFPSRFNRDFYSLTARYEHELWDGITLTSITNYQDLVKTATQDVDATPFTLIHVTQNQRLWQASQELRLAGTSDRFNWVVGGYGLKIKTDVSGPNTIDPAIPELFATFPPFFPGGPESPVALGDFAKEGSFISTQDTRSLAIFAQGDYKLTDIFTVVVGGRYSWDWKDYFFNSTPIAPSCTLLAPNYLASCYSFSGKRTDKNWSGKIQFEARPTDGLMLYVGVNRGTKAGGFNAPRNIPSGVLFANGAVAPGYDTVAYDAAIATLNSLMTFDQEVLTNYEGGFKLSIPEHRITFNGTLFHYDYKNYQAFTNNNANILVRNLPAKLTGLELEFSIRPVREVTLNLFGTHMFERKVIGVSLPESGRIVDRVMPQAPEWSIGGALNIEVPVGATSALTFNTSWKYDSEQQFTVFNAPSTLEPERVIGNISVGYKVDQLELSFFVNNVTDKAYRVFASDNSSFIAVTENTYGRPRWFGGSLTYRMGK